jgi:hypothetical protein
MTSVERPAIGLRCEALGSGAGARPAQRIELLEFTGDRRFDELFVERRRDVRQRAPLAAETSAVASRQYRLLFG